MNSLPKFNNLIELSQYFHDEKTCIAYLKSIRWANGSFCPYCGSVKVYDFKNGTDHKCGDCRKRFSIKVGTIFQDSKIPLSKWFMAIYMITAHKKGISSLQLGRDIGVTQKTAWFMLHRLRFASKTKSFNAPLKNTVEVDETYVGGKDKNKHMNKRKGNTQGRSTKDKTPVLGLAERNGNIIAVKIDNVKNQTITSTIVKNVVVGRLVISDEYRAYKSLGFLYKHSSINHSLGEYVNNEIHTNTIEGFWSILKRMIVGIYHFTSEKHLQKYLDECTFRYNTRTDTEVERFDKFLSNVSGRLQYNTLIA